MAAVALKLQAHLDVLPDCDYVVLAQAIYVVEPAN